MRIKHAKQLYYSSEQSFRNMALEYFTKEELEQVALPESWEGLSSEQKDTKDIHKKSMIYIFKLIDLLAAYNGDWVADYKDKVRVKHTIEILGDFLGIHYTYESAALLSFETKIKANHFYKHHLKLIKQAAPILWGVSFFEEKTINKVSYTVLVKGMGSNVYEYYKGEVNDHSNIRTLIQYEDWFSNKESMLAVTKEDNTKITYHPKKITTYTDGTHLLEGIEEVKEVEHVGFVIVCQDGTYTGYRGYYNNIENLINDEGWYLSLRQLCIQAKEKVTATQRLTIYKDESYLLEDIEQEKETAQGSESLGWALLDSSNNKIIGASSRYNTLKSLVGAGDWFNSKRAATCTATDDQGVYSIVPRPTGGYKLIQA